jgi:hypothetical protein
MYELTEAREVIVPDAVGVVKDGVFYEVLPNDPCMVLGSPLTGNRIRLEKVDFLKSNLLRTIMNIPNGGDAREDNAL